MAMTAEALLAAVDAITEHGGDIYVAPVDYLNPRCGYAARITLPVPFKDGPPTYRGSGDSARAALLDAVNKVPAWARKES